MAGRSINVRLRILIASLVAMFVVLAVVAYLDGRAAARAAEMIVRGGAVDAPAQAVAIGDSLRRLQWTVIAGVVIGVVCSAMLITNLSARRRELRELRASQLRLRSIMDGLFAYVALVDVDGTLVDINRAALEDAEVGRSEVIGRPFHEVHFWRNDPEARETVQRAIQSAADGATIRRDLDYRAPRGAVTTLDICCAPLRDRNGTVSQVLVTGIDISERRTLEAQFRQSQKMDAMGRLAGGVAHDFNNLLTVIKGYAELVLTDLPSDHPARPDVEEIFSAAARSAELTQQLLAFSRSQALSPRVVSPNSVVAGMDKMLRRLIPADIEFRIGLDADVGAVRVDPGQLEQVIMNLVVNARDAMAEGGTLTIQTSSTELSESIAEARTHLDPGRYVIIAVSDTGHGMTAEVQGRIFEPFFTTKAAGHGTGLGLATVFGIVRQSSGAVWVYSEPGEGTTFKVFLPWVASSVDLVEPALAATAERRGTETIVLIDDDSHVRVLAERALSRNGYRVFAFAEGEAALRHITSATVAPALLITDVVMPRIRGPEVADRLRAVWPGMRVLYVTGFTDRTIESDGTPSVLQKPFTPTVLLRSVREALRTD